MTVTLKADFSASCAGFRLGDQFRAITLSLGAEALRQGWVARRDADDFAGFALAMALRAIVCRRFPRLELFRLVRAYPEDVLAEPHRLCSAYARSRGAALLSRNLRHAEPIAVSRLMLRYGVREEAARAALSSAIAGALSAIATTKRFFSLDVDELRGVMRCEAAMLDRLYTDVAPDWLLVMKERRRTAPERAARRLLRALADLRVRPAETPHRRGDPPLRRELHIRNGSSMTAPPARTFRLAYGAV